MTKVLPNVRGRRGHSQRDAGKNGTLMLALQTEEGTTFQGMQEVSRSRKRQENELCLRASRKEHSPANTSMLAQRDHVRLHPHGYKTTHLIVKVTNFVVNCYSRVGN